MRENFKSNRNKKCGIFKSAIGTFKQKSGLAMGSSISASLATIFVNLMEKTVVKKYIDDGKVISYQRYADDCLVILKKSSIRSFLKDINHYDKGLKFTLQEMDHNDELIFLDSKVFIKNNVLEFIKFRKRGHLTVISNYKHSLMSYKYLRGGIFTALHRERNACSSQAIFLESLEELRDVFHRNSYPKWLIDDKVKTFLRNDKKPDRPETNISITFNYSSRNIEQYVYKLTNKITKFVPSFRVNVCFRSVKVTKLFSRHAKAETDIYDRANCVYNYNCVCLEKYIGETERCLEARIREHQQISKQSNISLHIQNCPEFIQKSREFHNQNINEFTSFQKARYAMFKSRFSIIQQGFRYKKARKKCEAYHIRIKRPKLNDQFDHKAFKLF